MTLGSGDIRYVRIFAEVPRGEASNDSGVNIDNGNFQLFRGIYDISSETLEMRPALLYSDMQSIVCFSLIPKCVTLNDLD